MRRLKIFITFALIITIGSVYATWNYARGSAVPIQITSKICMAQVNTSSSKGTISVSSSNFEFLVDDGGSYHAVLTASGQLQVSFTHNPGTDSETASKGIKMIATIEVKSEDNTKYEGLIPLSTNTTNGANVIDLTPNGPSRTATLTASQILNAITLADVILDSKKKNDDFANVIKDYTIYITISENVTTT